MGELILHIGTTKTGTTSLQKFFFENREKLLSHGVAYPVFMERPDNSHLKNGILLNRYCINISEGNDPGFQIEKPEDSLEYLVRSLSENDRVLLSNENISQFASGRYSSIESSEFYWPVVASFLNEIGASVSVIVVYLRRQDDWAASHWRESVKTGRTNQPFKEFCDELGMRNSMDYAATLKAVEAALGTNAKVVVRRYNRTAFEGGDIYHDFCAAVGIAWNDAYKIPKAEANKSLSFDVAEALRMFADKAPKDTPLRRNVLIPLARKLSRESPDAPGTTPFSEEEARSFMEPFSAGNRRIANSYFGGKPLFSEDYSGRPIWVPDEERIARYRAILQEGIRQHEHAQSAQAQLALESANHPRSISQSLKAIRKKLIGG